jgi:hypothetical protein
MIQGREIDKNQLLSMAWMALCLVLPSLRFIQKYLGNAGLIIFPLAIFALVYAVVLATEKIPQKKWFPWIYLLAFVLVVVAFAVIYPLANSGAYGGIGSDRDDAINIGTTRLFGGQYPYYAKTYLGNPLSPLPGAFLLAAPFVLLLGNSAYQNLFWLPIFFLLSRSLLRNDTANIALMAVLFVGCPMVMHEVVHGADLLSNSLYCLVAVCLFRFSLDQGVAWKKWLAAVFLGVAFASRFNFLFLFPVLFCSAARSRWKDGFLLTGIAILTFLCLTLPFYIYDPASFSPLLMTVNHISSRSPSAFPTWIIPLLVIVLSSLMGMRCRVEKLGTLLFCCSVIQMVPVIAIVLFQSLRSHHLDLGSDGFGTTGYGLVFVFFGVLSAALNLFPKNFSRQPCLRLD